MFPKLKDIPNQFQVTPFKQKTWLLDGKLVEWKGPYHPVLSAVCIQDKNTSLPYELGSYP